MLLNINRYYIDQSTNKIINPNTTNLHQSNLDRHSYSIATDNNLTFKNKSDMLYNMSLSLLDQGEHKKCSRMVFVIWMWKNQYSLWLCQLWAAMTKSKTILKKKCISISKTFRVNSFTKTRKKKEKPELRWCKAFLRIPSLKTCWDFTSTQSTHQAYLTE